MITVFTPTYNRAHTLPRLYDSLLSQTSKDFEWICINDGSTDETDSLFDQWLSSDRPFPIIYKKIPNGGKHRAINKAVNMAHSNAFFIVDSDDYLLPEAISKVHCWFDQISNDPSFAGVSGLKGFSPNDPVGGYGCFQGDHIDATNLERDEYNLSNDKSEIYKTSILKEYPFPEFDGENFITEPVVWNLIAKDGYKIRWFNEVIYICQYMDDGLTANSHKKFMENPKGTLAYLSVLEQCHDPREVDVIRLRYYNDIINNYGIERAMEIIRMANPS